jgi:hypothetical protein
MGAPGEVSSFPLGFYAGDVGDREVAGHTSLGVGDEPGRAFAGKLIRGRHISVIRGLDVEAIAAIRHEGEGHEGSGLQLLIQKIDGEHMC